MKLTEVKPLIDKMARETAEACGGFRSEQADAEIRIALETAFVAGVRSGLKYTSNAKFAELFAKGETE